MCHVLRFILVCAGTTYRVALQVWVGYRCLFLFFDRAHYRVSEDDNLSGPALLVYGYCGSSRCGSFHGLLGVLVLCIVFCVLCFVFCVLRFAYRVLCIVVILWWLFGIVLEAAGSSASSCFWGYGLGSCALGLLCRSWLCGTVGFRCVDAVFFGGSFV